MSFALKPGKSIRRELRRIARQELESASQRLLEPRRGDGDVHESRKSVKKVEALAALLEQVGGAPPRKDVKRLREARRALSSLRDAHVVIETFDRLLPRFAPRIPKQTSAKIRMRLTRGKSATKRRAQADAGSVARAGKTLRKVRRSVKEWPAPSINLSELPKVLRRSFRASQRAMTRAQARGRAPDFHEWRKRVKSLWYQLRLAEHLVSGLSAQIAEFSKLQETLGEDHNLVVLRTWLARDRALRASRLEVNRLTAVSAARQEELRQNALALGTRLYKRSPKEFATDLRERLRPKGTPRRKPSRRPRARATA